MKKPRKKRVKNKQIRIPYRSAAHQGDLGRQLTRADSVGGSWRIISFERVAADLIFEDLLDNLLGRSPALETSSQGKDGIGPQKRP